MKLYDLWAQYKQTKTVGLYCAFTFMIVCEGVLSSARNYRMRSPICIRILLTQFALYLS